MSNNQDKPVVICQSYSVDAETGETKSLGAIVSDPTGKLRHTTEQVESDHDDEKSPYVKEAIEAVLKADWTLAASCLSNALSCDESDTGGLWFEAGYFAGLSAGAKNKLIRPASLVEDLQWDAHRAGMWPDPEPDNE